MRYNRVGDSDVEVSEIGLGGHEFLGDGRVKAMGEEFHKSVTPGVIWDGFGQENRRTILRLAYEGGINFLDVTMDSEKEALGRNLQDLPPPHSVYIQTRPEGMVYNNDPADEDKSRVLDYGLLKAEAERGCELLHREQIDFYNFGLFAPAIQRQPGYLGKLARNVERLKEDGLIRFACVDTLSGEALSLEMIETGSFDAVFTNLSIVCDAPLRSVIPAAQQRGMAIFTRETFLKGGLFRLGEEVGITDRSGLARAAVRWLLARGVVTSLVLGAARPEHVAANLKAADEPELTAEDKAVLDRLTSSPEFAKAQAGQDDFFVKGWG